METSQNPKEGRKEMKAKILCTALFAVLMVAFIVACGGDDESSSVKDVAVPEIESSDNLDSCGKSNEGDTVYVAEEDVYLLCHESEWKEIVLPDSVEVKTVLVIGYDKKTHNECYYDGKEYLAQPLTGQAKR